MLCATALACSPAAPPEHVALPRPVGELFREVRSILPLPTGEIWVGGTATDARELGLARLDPETLAAIPLEAPQLRGYVNRLWESSSAGFVAFGSFNRRVGSGSSDFARFRADGSVESRFFDNASRFPGNLRFFAGEVALQGPALHFITPDAPLTAWPTADLRVARLDDVRHIGSGYMLAGFFQIDGKAYGFAKATTSGMLTPFGPAGAVPVDLARILDASDEGVLALRVKGFRYCAEEPLPLEFGADELGASRSPREGDTRFPGPSRQLMHAQRRGDCVGSFKLAHSLHVVRAEEGAADVRLLPTCLDGASADEVINLDDRWFVAVGQATLQLDGGCEPVRVWKFDKKGMLDLTFARNATRLGISKSSGRLTLAPFGAGTILIGGGFETAGGQFRGRLLVISADGERVRDTGA